MQNIIRQGDVLLIPIHCPLTPTKRTQTKKARLVEGEATGHHHSAEGDVEVLEYDEKGFQDWLTSIGVEGGGVCGLSIPTGGVLTHQEHGEIPLKEKEYVVIRQREYSPEEIRNVQD